MKNLPDILFSPAALLACVLLLCASDHGAAQPAADALVLTPALRPSYATNDLTGTFGTNDPAVRTIGAQLDRALDHADLPALIEIARTLRVWEVARHAVAPTLSARNVCDMLLARAGLPADNAALTQLAALLKNKQAGFGTPADQPLIKETAQLIAATSMPAIRTRGPVVAINITINNTTAYRVQVLVNNVLLCVVEPRQSITKTYTATDRVMLVTARVPNDLAWETQRIKTVSGTNICMELRIKP
jgi:hypothetical protein